ncbi:MAG: ribosome biogenesis factor YjgA [Methylococcales bacterium]
MYEEELDENGVDYYAIRPNKSQIKRDIAELAVFAEELVALPLAQLNQFDLDVDLFKALVAAAGLPSTGARKRQMKYICGMLRKIDIAPLQEKLARLQSKSAHAVREHHAAERWREQLLNGEEAVLTRFLTDFPDADRQQLRHLVRSAKKELTLAAPPKYARLLYRYLKELLTHEEGI